MKCFAIVVMMALACANASVIPYAGYPWGPVAPWAGPWGAPAAVDVHAPWAVAPWVGGPAAIDVAHAPWAGPWVAPVAHAVVPAHAATYTAKTRGAVHTAPLPGHVLSQTSLNLAAPAGTW